MAGCEAEALLDEARERLGTMMRQESTDCDEPPSPQSALSPRVPWRWLDAESAANAEELAEMLREAAPRLRLRSRGGAGAAAAASRSQLWHAASLEARASARSARGRLRAAAPLPTAPGAVDWSRLVAAVSSEMLAADEWIAAAANNAASAAAAASGRPTSPPGKGRSTAGSTPTADALDINSGGRVLFCLFEAPLAPTPAPTPPVSRAATPEQPLAAARGAGEPPTPPPHGAGAGAGGWLSAREGCLVVKLMPSRLLVQSEQFAQELARQLGVCAPDTHILRSKGATEGEWRAAAAAAAALAAAGSPELAEEMASRAAMLVMEFVPGWALSRPEALAAATAPGALLRTAEDVGRLFTADMLLGNPDRLACEALGWRGNPENVLLGSAGRWAGRVVAIDAVVQRCAPGGHASAEDAACDRFVELALNDAAFARAALAEALAPGGGDAAAAAAAAAAPGAVEAFQRGLAAALESTAAIKGLLEMMAANIEGWMKDFLADIEASAPDLGASAAATPRHGGAGAGAASRRGSEAGVHALFFGAGGAGAGAAHARELAAAAGVGGAGAAAAGGAPGGRRGDPSWAVPASPSAAAAAAQLSAAALQAQQATTRKIMAIRAEAQHNAGVSEKVERWKAFFREKGEELRAAVEDWQAKREAGGARGGAGGAAPPRLTTGFLDGTHPIVDPYELNVRLTHMLRRLGVLQRASATARPTQLLPGLHVGGAVEAASHHVLRHLGVTHVLNATEDLFHPTEKDPEPMAGFETMRVPLRDEEEEDVAPHLAPAAAFIDAALAPRPRGHRPGGVLVHCHAGRSRSVTLVLAWLMVSRRWTLARALEFVQGRRPVAAPNAGYTAALLRLEGELFGRQSRLGRVKRPKPAPRLCPECGDKAGLSRQSVLVHLRLRHPAEAAAAWAAYQAAHGGAGGGGGGGSSVGSGSIASLGSPVGSGPATPLSPEPGAAPSPRGAAAGGSAGAAGGWSAEAAAAAAACFGAQRPPAAHRLSVASGPGSPA